TVLSEQIQKDAWFKLWGNMTVNPISAMTGATTDLILDDELVRGFISSVMLEAREIGARIGIPIAQQPEARHQVTRKLGAFKTSMLQDVEAGKPVELDALVTVVKELGELTQVQTPFTDALLGLSRLHEPASAVEYAGRLRELAKRHEDALLVVMRVYFEKPRTRMGWKGLVYDPGLDGAGDIGEGLRAARRLLLECARLRLPAASEILDLVTPQYYAELLAWGAIGARTVESPLHRQMASALSAPLGFKNTTSGGIDVAIDAIHVAAQPHTFPSISLEGRAIVVTTTGNPDAHLVLRGGNGGPNYDAVSVAQAAQALADAGLPPR